MKRAIALGLLIVLQGIGVGCAEALSQNQTAPDTFETFTDWYRSRSRLPAATQLTVEV